MLYCEECGEIFWESNLDEGRYCPSCGADVVTPAGECRQCGETFPPQDIEGGLCRDCRDDLKRRCRAFWSGLTQAEQDYILDQDYHPADDRDAAAADVSADKTKGVVTCLYTGSKTA